MLRVSLATPQIVRRGNLLMENVEFASYNWEDPLNMASLLTEDEQAIQCVPPLFRVFALRTES